MNKNEAADQTEKVVDEGKVRALYKAGWLVSNIAKDMGVNEKRIYEILTKLRKEGKGLC